MDFLTDSAVQQFTDSAVQQLTNSPNSQGHAQGMPQRIMTKKQSTQFRISQINKGYAQGAPQRIHRLPTQQFTNSATQQKKESRK